MDVIITGGAGFIGSKLVDRLCEDNRVVVVDNLHSGSVGNIRCSGARLMRMDSKDIAKAYVEPDVIFHLGMYSASAYYDGPVLMNEVIEGATRIFDFAVKHKAKVVAASSSSVYYGQDPPQNEEMIPHVAGFYTGGRIAMEGLAGSYARDHSLEVTVLRPFSVYGKGGEVKGKMANIASRLILAAMGMDDPVLYGDGTATRDFINVDDVVEAFIMAADVQGFGIFNVGTGVSCSLNALKARVEAVAPESNPDSLRSCPRRLPSAHSSRHDQGAENPRIQGAEVVGGGAE